MSITGKRLKERNEEIVKCITEMKAQRTELHFLIERQQEEKARLQTEVQRITYKLALLNKSLAQRVVTITNYDRTIQQAEEGYLKLVETSGLLLSSVKQEAGQLEQIMDKKTNTSASNLSVYLQDTRSDSVKDQTDSESSAAELSLKALDFEMA